MKTVYYLPYAVTHQKWQNHNGDITQLSSDICVM